MIRSFFLLISQTQSHSGFPILTLLSPGCHKGDTRQVQFFDMNLGFDSGRCEADGGFPQGERLTRVFDAVGSTVWPSLGFQAENGGPMFASRMLASILILAYSRGRFASEEIEEACRNEEDFRYLCSSEAPEARVFRRFRRMHAKSLIEGLGHLSVEGAITDVSVAMERARRCLDLAVAADSLALDF